MVSAQMPCLLKSTAGRSFDSNTVVVALMIMMMMTTTKCDDVTQYILTQAERVEFIRAHNRFRNDFSTIYPDHPQPPAANMIRMYWNVLLEASALDYSSECNDLKHGQTNLRDGSAFRNLTAKWGSSFGQNLFKGSAKPNLTSMIFAFANETKYFQFDANGGGTCQTGKVCGHYTQVVWAATVYVGCGVTKCSGYWLGTCNYVGPGNYRGSPPYKTGNPCSQCSSGKLDLTQCDGKLCVPNDICSPVTECAVVDKDNCLCSDADNRKIVTDLLSGAGSKGQIAPIAVILSVVSSAVVVAVGGRRLL